MSNPAKLAVDWVLKKERLLLKAITERKRIAEELQQSKERYQALFDRSLDCVYIHDFEGRFLDANDAALNLLGYKREEISDLNFNSLLSEDQLPLALKTMQEIRETGFQKRLTEYKLRLRNGKEVYLEINESAILSKGSYTAIQAVARNITERKRAEEALRESETWLSDVGEMARVGGWQLNVETKQVLWTSETYRIHETPQGERIDLPKALLYYDLPGRSTLETALQHCLETGEGFDLELPFTSAKGRHLWVRAMGRAVKADGKAIQLKGTFQDITERKWTEEALRESGALVQAAINILPVGLWIFNAEGKIVTSNAAAQRIWAGVRYVGIDQLGEYKGWRTDSGKLIEAHEWAGARALEKGETTSEEEVEIECFDGTHKIILDSAVPLRKSDGSIGGAVTINQDITERKRAEEALLQEKTFTDKLFNAPHDTVFLFDPTTGKPLRWNERFAEVSGYCDEELAGLKAPDDFYDEDELEKAKGTIARVFAEGQGSVELSLVTKQGAHIPFEYAVTVVNTADGKTLLLSMGRDLTERKQLQQTAEKARADFLFAVSHELKTPLHVMAATQEKIESLPDEQRVAQFREYEDIWRRNMMRLRFIIENLVDSQRPEGMGIKLEKQPEDLVNLVREVAQELEPIASARSIQLRFQGDSLSPVSLDRNAIRRLVENLLTNAIKFSHSGGQVEIRLRTEGKMVCLEVCDCGLGIDPQIKPFLFQPFYRSPEAIKAGVQGTGLGLYVSKMIAGAHGGTISLESELGKGTTISVCLPLQEEAVPRPDPPKA